MKKNRCIQKCMITGIVLLFISSIISPLVIGYDNELKNMRTIDDLAFNCYDKYGFSKINNYKKFILIQCSEVVESEEIVQTYKITSTVPSDGPMDSAWPMKCHDNQHTSRSPYSTVDNIGTEKWRFETDRWIEGGPIISDDDTIYFGCFDYYLYALYPNGTLKWKFKTGGWIWSTPAMAKDGTIYIGSLDNKIYAIKTNGTLKWKFDTGASVFSSPVIGEDGTIYFGTMGEPNWGCRIYALNPNGMEKWHYNTGYKVTSDPAIGNDGTVYIGSGDTYLYAMNPNGTLKWRFKTDDLIQGHPSIANDGTIYIGSFDDYLYALYPNGTMKWKCKVGYGTETNPSIASDGTIYVGGKYLFAINPNGSLKWSFNLGSNRYIDQSSPAISADGTIYVGTNIGETAGGEIIAVNPNGTEQWRKKIADEWVESSPCIGEDGTVYIGSSSMTPSGDSYGYLYAFGTPDKPQPPTITGPSTGKIGEKQYYTFNTTDPQEDDVEYYVNWGDDTNSGWTEAAPSGMNITLNHTWTEEGTFEIRAKARDIHGHVSDWTELEVSMPKNKAISSPFMQFLENHPRLFPILKYILRL